MQNLLQAAIPRGGCDLERRAPRSFSRRKSTRPFSVRSISDKRYAEALMLSLSNELIFTCATTIPLLIASKDIGEREVVEKRWGFAAEKKSYTYHKEDQIILGVV
jgi:hypothetical protein